MAQLKSNKFSKGEFTLNTIVFTLGLIVWVSIFKIDSMLPYNFFFSNTEAYVYLLVMSVPMYVFIFMYLLSEKPSFSFAFILLGVVLSYPISNAFANKTNDYMISKIYERHLNLMNTENSGKEYLVKKQGSDPYKMYISLNDSTEHKKEALSYKAEHENEFRMASTDAIYNLYLGYPSFKNPNLKKKIEDMYSDNFISVYEVEAFKLYVASLNIKDLDKDDLMALNNIKIN